VARRRGEDDVGQPRQGLQHIGYLADVEAGIGAEAPVDVDGDGLVAVLDERCTPATQPAEEVERGQVLDRLHQPLAALDGIREEGDPPSR
jgi:hypothetical protein